MLLIGETGSGKTSFLNLICNYAHLEKLGRKFDKNGFEDLKRFDDEDLENKDARRMESKTNGAKLYDLAADSTDSTYKADLDKLEFCVIDTPGFGDVRGFDKDEENLQRILSCIEEDEYINCVCIVINGRLARITANLQYVLTGIASILPTPVLDKILFVFTNVADPLELNFDPTELKIYFGEQVDTTNYICIDNPYSKFEKAIKKEKEGKMKKEQIVQSLKKSFNDTRGALNTMCRMMKKFEKVYTRKFTQLHEKKQEIEASVLGLLSTYDTQKKLEKELVAAQKKVDAALKKKQLHSGFSLTKKIPTAELIDTSTVHNTLCRVPDCNSNCHLKCRLPMSSDDITVIKDCYCMDLGKREDCIECGHSLEHHYHVYKRWEKKTVATDLVNDDMRKEFEEATSMEDGAKKIKKGLEEQRQDSEAKRQKLSAQLLEKIEEFGILSVGRNYVKLIESQIGVIKLRIGGSTGPGVQDLIKVKEQLDEKLKVLYETLGISIQ